MEKYHTLSMYVDEEWATLICADLKVKVPRSWGSYIKLWYGSYLQKLEWQQWVITSSNESEDDSLRRDILHLLQNFGD